MAELLPAAQAVLDAFENASDGEYVEGVWVVNERTMLAAALRAAADQVVPEEVRVRKGMRPGGIGSTTPTEWMQDQRLHTRRQLLAIAAELEGHET
jgi:hypothetical protein